MADSASLDLTRKLDIRNLLSEAQHRWLRPAEICEILRNYQRFDIQTEAPNRPPSGSLFLFDRKVLRYFRKDGHEWRKKKDGKTVKEAHEKLKVGSIDVLHCYYAHGEENESFQRRSYWMLEQDLMHIVFVHYLEVKGNRTSSIPITNFSTTPTKEPSGNADSMSPTSTLSSGCEEADSADSSQTRFIYQPFGLPTLNTSFVDNSNDSLWRLSQVPNTRPSTSGAGTFSSADMSDIHIFSNTESQSLEMRNFNHQQELTLGRGIPPHLLSNTSLDTGKGTVRFQNGGMDCNHSIAINSNCQPDDELIDNLLRADFAYNWDPLVDQTTGLTPPDYDFEVGMGDFLMQISDVDFQYRPSDPLEGSGKYSNLLKQSLLQGDDTLKKVDSFSRWISKELGEVDDLKMRPSSAIPWVAADCAVEYSLSPSLSRDQLFSISNFSPKWSYANTETEVHVIGSFLRSEEEKAKCRWSCMFGEVEVAADVIADGVLCCRCPSLPAATVPFYVTNSNRLSCSEVREFDYRPCPPAKPSFMDINLAADETQLHLRLEKLLSFRSSVRSAAVDEDASEKRRRIEKILSMKEEGEKEVYLLADSTPGVNVSSKEEKELFVESHVREMFFSWVVHKVSESARGPCVLDGDGQGVLHFAAALGYNWAIVPILSAGVSINFRDVNGWTALHWAAFCGREETVALLVALGASTGALTDPSEEFPFSRSPADLASTKGHKGISGFLAESSLTNVLRDLTVNDPKAEGSADSERNPASLCYSDARDELSMKDSLCAVRNATQAASRIHQVYRMQSFQRKKLIGDEDDVSISDGRLLKFLSSKSSKPGCSDGVAHSAAVHIQKKFRGWRKRKEFLIIRQRIVKLQAHVRGHQVRKKYKPIIWSVGIMEKVILRWRRKKSGLRGFRRENLAGEDDSYDVLKEGRKQNEERMQNALSRVKSMIHYPEGRAQYTRLLTVVDDFRRSNQQQSFDDGKLLEHDDVMDNDEGMLDLESLLEDDAFMSMAYE